MTNREIFIAFVSSLISSFVGAFLFWLIQQSYLNKRERQKEQEKLLIKPRNREKIVTNDIFYQLSPGSSVDSMKEMLGVPNKFRRNDCPVFTDETFETNVYIYGFNNAFVKVTSKDNESIDSLTVMPFDNSLSINSMMNPDETEGKFNELKVSPQLAKSSTHTVISTIREYSFALGYSVGPPIYQYFTFFGAGNVHKYRESKDPNLFIGEVIRGVCISNTTDDVYYIYEYELI